MKCDNCENDAIYVIVDTSQPICRACLYKSDLSIYTNLKMVQAIEKELK